MNNLPNESAPFTNPNESAPIPKSRQRTTVRFSPDEYEQIRSASKLTGKSVPDLLRESFFPGRKLRLLFSKEDAHAICSELRRIGNNVNQIARRVNSGALEGWHSEFAVVTKQLSEMLRMVVEVYGRR